MKKLKKLLTIILAFALLATTMIGCKSATESAIDDMDAFITKWEQKADAGSISADDKAEFKKELMSLNSRYEGIKSNPAKLTPQQQERAMQVSKRMLKLMMKKDLISIGDF